MTARVLVVDDEPAVRFALEEALAAFQVTSAASAAEALPLAAGAERAGSRATRQTRGHGWSLTNQRERSVSGIRTITSRPEAKVSRATAPIDQAMPKRSARTPARSAPRAYPLSRQRR